MTNVEVKKNKSLNGSGLSINMKLLSVPINIILKDSLLRENEASNLGGGLYYHCED